ncbi:hypothetical protein IAI18_08785 [Acetobacteraceae bacterium H6797]|nr:hypothetical protein [Acetobacteraceae bacterium H6797]
MSRDFGAFMLSMMLLPTLGLVVLVALIIAIRAGRRARAAICVAALLLAPMTYELSRRYADEAWFLVWSRAHEEMLRQAEGRDAIITRWDRWGTALTGGNDAYLIADSQDRSMTIEGAEAWRPRMELACPIVATMRLRPGVYLVATYDCPLDAPALAP